MIDQRDRRSPWRSGPSALAILILCLTATLAGACGSQEAARQAETPQAERYADTAEPKGTAMADKVVKTDQEWQQCLTPEQYRIARQKGTERAFTGKYYDHHEEGMYRCVACGNELFSSDTKYDSGSGWPAFWEPVAEEKVAEEKDSSLGTVRTEVLCRKCDAHLGHVFEDGPRDKTGLRYCINSAALDFAPADEEEGGEDGPEH